METHQIFENGLSTLAVLLLGSKLYTDWTVRQSEKKYPPAGQFVEVNGIRMHYVRQGAGRPIVFIHGSFGSLYYFTKSIFNIAAREYEVLAFDQPGYGYSERPRHQNMMLKDHAACLHEALKKLGIEKPLLAAHSWGGGVAMAYALEYPEDLSALILISGYVAPAEGPVDREYRLPTAPILGPLFLFSLLAPIGKIQSPRRTRESFAPNETDKDYARVVSSLALRPRSYQWNAQDIRNCSPSLRTMVPHYGEIRVPVSILTGDSDSVTRREIHADWLHRRIPHSKLIVLPQTGHMISFARTSETMQAIRDVWERALQAGTF